MNRRQFTKAAVATIGVVTLGTHHATASQATPAPHVAIPVRGAHRFYYSQAPRWALATWVELYDASQDAKESYERGLAALRENRHHENVDVSHEVTRDVLDLGERTHVFEGIFVTEQRPFRLIYVADDTLVFSWWVQGRRNFHDIAWELADDVLPAQPLREVYLDSQLLDLLPMPEQAAVYGLTLGEEEVYIPPR